MENEMYELIKNMDRKIDELQKQVSELKINKKKIVQTEGNWWSIEIYGNNVLVNFSKGTDFDEFKNYVKELGGTWLLGKKSWKFPIMSTEQLIEKISEKFPDKEFKDLRDQ